MSALFVLKKVGRFSLPEMLGILDLRDIYEQTLVFIRTETFEDMLASGVIDPAKTVKCALQNAASAAGTLLTTNCAVLKKGGE